MGLLASFLENEKSERPHANLRISANFETPERADSQFSQAATFISEASIAPEPYQDAWTRLQCRKPVHVEAAEWRRAIDDAAAFFSHWGALAVEWQWPPGALFDVPGEDGGSGLVWFMAGETVEAFGPEHARLDDGRIFDRLQIRREGGA